MVKTINPLFSSSVSGKVGGLIFQTSQYGTRAITYTPQRKKPTEKQIQQNFYFGQVADNWRLEPQEVKTEYNNRAKGLKMTGFNLYIKENIQHPT